MVKGELKYFIRINIKRPESPLKEQRLSDGSCSIIKVYGI